MKSKIAVYPGTFDPITYGHMDLIKRASKIFDEVIVAVAYSQDKNPLFSVEERVQMIKESIGNIKGVKIDAFDSLVVDYMKKVKAQVVIRGVRMISDFEYEFQMALTNRKLSPEIETIFMMPHETYCYLSSKLIKETASLGAAVEKFVPEKIAHMLREKLLKK